MVAAMKQAILSLAVILALSGCASLDGSMRTVQEPMVSKIELKQKAQVPASKTGSLTVAVYNFRDLTGQRKSSTTIASLSSAVTQGADSYLISSLQTVGNGKWFKVVERGGLDNLIKERQIIRQMRELYEGKDAKPLPPMVFAGILIEGGIIGYDSNTMSGGSGARLLGIGASTEYRQDEVTISLRTVSVATGEVLTSVTVNKTVISYQDKMGVLKFYDAGTNSLELETGTAKNESMNKAVRMAIEAAVIETIYEGERKGHWAFAVPKEDKKDELVQKDTKQIGTPEVKTTTTDNKPDGSKAVGENEKQK